MDAPARFGDRDALDPVDAALVLQAAERSRAANLHDRLLDAADARPAGAHHLGLPPAALGVAGVEPDQFGGEEPGLVATGSGPHLDNYVALVIRVAWHEGDLGLMP